MILRHFILKFVWKQTENDYSLTVKCYKRRNYHTLQSQIRPFKVWLNSTLTVVQLCYPPLKIHFLFVWLYPFVLYNSKHPTYNEGSLLLFEKNLLKNPHLVQRWKMKWVLSVFSLSINHAASCQSLLGWNRFKLIKHIKVFPYTLFHFNLHCTLLRHGCPICQ